MAISRKNGSPAQSALMVRLDAESKQHLIQAAELRQISVSDYIRDVAIRQARQEVMDARERTLRLSPADQLTFWQALHAPAKPTAAQKKLGKLMRSLA
jgi:uncharacterized protein (DUF1778 family)